jgi:phosphomannomutase
MTLLQRFARVEQTRVGSPYINQAMQAARANNPEARVAGYEANGGYLLGSCWAIAGRNLEALATRDAALPLVCALLLAQQGVLTDAAGRQCPIATVADLVRIFPRHTYSAVVDREHDQVPYGGAETGQRLVRLLSCARFPVLEVDYYTGTCVLPVAGDASRHCAFAQDPTQISLRSELDRLRARLAVIFTADAGFGVIRRLNYLDGVRIEFLNGDIIHLRPSGNAPEFRFYAEADTPERARELGGHRLSIVKRLLELMDQNEAA